jgi:hypothetical protein
MFEIQDIEPIPIDVINILPYNYIFDIISLSYDQFRNQYVIRYNALDESVLRL